MHKLKQHMTKFWKDESGQGTTEYILLLVVVVGVAVLFKNQITSAINQKLEWLSSQMGQFGNN